jgi:phosphoribosylformylglycinamidine synthase
MLFGEDQARYLLTASPAEAEKIVADAKAKDVPARIIGTTGGDALELPGEKPVAIAALDKAHEGWLPTYMAGQA